MARRQLNNVSGTAVSNPITLSSSTTNTCTWSSAPSIPQIARPDVVVLIVEPDTANEEIVHLVGYPGSGTAGLVLRAAEPNSLGAQTAIAHSAVAWIHGPTAQDFKPQAARLALRAYAR